MARELIFGIKPITTTISGYRVARNGFILTLSDPAGTQLGRITVSPSGEQRGALWLQDSLVGEFEYAGGKWHLYPIEGGSIASRALRADPLEYLIERHERDQYNSAKERTRQNRKAAVA
jgi:hypothetical protein